MKVALFGGAFDPPHRGHQQVAVELLKQEVVDEVRLVPVKNHAFDKEMSPAKQRLAMSELVASDHEKILVERYELESKGVSYSHKTLKALSAAEPENEFVWVIGSDNLAHFHKWGDYQQLLREFVVYVYPRRGHPMQPLREGMVALTGFPEVVVSSTTVREKIRAGKDVSELVDEKILWYAKNNNLYK